jgi:beta-glucosidase
MSSSRPRDSTVTTPSSSRSSPTGTTGRWLTCRQVHRQRRLAVHRLTPLFSFGYGLSYTTFSFSNLQAGTLPEGGDASVTATVNTGSRTGADVV